MRQTLKRTALLALALLLLLSGCKGGETPETPAPVQPAGMLHLDLRRPPESRKLSGAALQPGGRRNRRLDRAGSPVPGV